MGKLQIMSAGGKMIRFKTFDVDQETLGFN
jgi:hypothetical protein